MGMVFWLLTKSDQYPASNWLVANLNLLKEYYLLHSLSTVLIFCLAHLTASTLSIPGSCTLLNTIAGALFGFWRGTFIVYSITITGGCLGYFLGQKLPLSRIKKKYEKQIIMLSQNLSNNNYLFMILLRLSPLLPFGVVNIILGFLNLNFGFYISTTIIGVFFDVTLLNSLGAFLSGAPKLNAKNKWEFLLIFLGLCLLFYCVKIFKNKLIAKNCSRGV